MREPYFVKNNYNYYMLITTNWYAHPHDTPSRLVAFKVVNKDNIVKQYIITWESYVRKSDEFSPNLYWGSYFFPDQIVDFTDLMESFIHKLEMQDANLDHHLIFRGSTKFSSCLKKSQINETDCIIFYKEKIVGYVS